MSSNNADPESNDDSWRPIAGETTEDYFNDAWSFRIADGLYTGVPVADGTGVSAHG